MPKPGRGGNTFKRNNYQKGDLGCSQFADPQNSDIVKLLDTESNLIKTVHFNCVNGKYLEDLIERVRRIYSEFDPKKTNEESLLKVILEGDGEREKALSFYLSLHTLYLLCLAVGGYVFEFGMYTNEEVGKNHHKEEDKRGLEAKDKRGLEAKASKQDRKHGKKMKHKKEAKKTKEPTQRKFVTSFLLGIGDGYGDGLSCTNSVTYGYNILLKSIDTINEGRHVPVYGKVNPLCWNWKKPLTTITVMVCEGSRFYPVSYYISDLMCKKDTKSLRSEVHYLFQNWEKMSKVLNDRESVSLKQLMDKGSLELLVDEGSLEQLAEEGITLKINRYWEWERLNTEMVEALKKCREWLVGVIALKCRSTNLRG